MSAPVDEPAPRQDAELRPGYTRVSAQALSSTARAVAGDLFGVDPYLVRVFLRDDAGFLALGINFPLPVVAVAGPPPVRSWTGRGPSAHCWVRNSRN